MMIYKVKAALKIQKLKPDYRGTRRRCGIDFGRAPVFVEDPPPKILNDPMLVCRPIEGEPEGAVLEIGDEWYPPEEDGSGKESDPDREPGKDPGPESDPEPDPDPGSEPEGEEDLAPDPEPDPDPDPEPEPEEPEPEPKKRTSTRKSRSSANKK